jgi:hypothetical protein|tara:strand:- start:6578 stop:7744 length:1167 start_codon:yes stop_codon:yes gene_type:complete
MGFFSGLFGALSPPTPPVPVKPYLPFNRSGVGHVLDVILDEKHPQYNPEENRIIGTIFYRDAFASPGGSSFSFMEAILSKQATPLDRSNFKVPLPGEQVIVYMAKSNKLEGPDVLMKSENFYGAVVGMTTNITQNTAPFIGIDPDNINPFLPGARSVAELSRRFDKKIKNLEAFKNATGKPEVHKQIALNEGDFILQGRFGGSIRFAGTPIDSEIRGQDWARGKKGVPGDPIILMRVDNDKGTFDDLEESSLTVADLNEDASSLCITSTQQLPLDLAIPDKGKKAHPLASWANTYGIEVKTDAKKTANKAKDGEASRSGENKTAPKEANTGEDLKDENTDQSETDTAATTDAATVDTSADAAVDNVDKPDGYNGFYSEGDTDLSGYSD